MSSSYEELKCILAVIAVIAVTSDIHKCKGSLVYFPMTSIQMNIPLNEKSQSIFSKIPIGRFQVLAAVNNSIAPNYIYSLEENDLLRINSTTGEVFMRNDFKTVKSRTTFMLTAISKSNLSLKTIPHMTLELQPQNEDEFCSNMENICFWSAAHYFVIEDDTLIQKSGFRPVQIGTLNPRGSKYICAQNEVKYAMEKGGDFFTLVDNKLYTKVLFDHESLNAKAQRNMDTVVNCTVKLMTNKTIAFRKHLNITVVDRNDNGPMVQNQKTYHFQLPDPHFKVNDTIGEKIIFTDKDSLETNTHLTYLILNDSKDFVRPVCNAYEVDHTEQRNSVFSCQLLFSRNGILSEAEYCFILAATDNTVEENALNATQVKICLHTDLSLIHETDRPLAMALRSRPNRKSNVVNNEDSILTSEGGTYVHGIERNFLNIYTKDVYVYRTAMAYNRVTEPENVFDFIHKTELKSVRFTIAEDRTRAFGITPVAGIIYVKNSTSLAHSLETVYFLNITWHDSHKRYFVINVHLVSDRPNNFECSYKVKSHSQSCAQIKYQKQCVKFCGLATDGGSCQWRGSNNAIFSRNFGSCVPNTTHCPDNLCDPLEELNIFVCPQDCAPSLKIMGPHSSNENKKGILAASGTCICEDNGKCSCAPLEGDEPKSKRKRKNELKIDSSEKGINSAKTSHNKSVDGIAGQQQANSDGFICNTKCQIIAITCPLIVVVLVISFILIRRHLSRSTFSKRMIGSQKVTTLNYNADNYNALRGDLPLVKLHPETSFKFNSNISKWEFPRDHLILDAILGEGEFGKVVKAYATEIAGKKGVTTVAVKMLKNGANSVEHMALLSEFELLQEVSHPNVIKLLGACTQGDSPLIIIEYARYGSLRSYLRLGRKIECSGVDFADGVEPVTVKNMLSFAWQICKGMAYLTDIKLVHRDLAARNVLLADGKICKISDFGLTRDVYEDDAYLKRSRDRVPVKWMAPESLADHVYTTKSDVWAFGILCWELITLGASPYPGIPPQNLYHLLKTGYRMERPENCSEEVYSIVRTCWTDDANARPSFKYLASQFEQLLGNNARYIELETNAISNPAYCSSETERLMSGSQTELVKLTEDLGKPYCLNHLWRPPKMRHDSQDCPNSCESLPTQFVPPPGYDMPRPSIEATTAEQVRGYENDLRFPLNIHKSMSTESPNSSKGNDNKDHCSVPVKHGRSYMDMVNKSPIPDNLDSENLKKHFSKNIYFRFSSLLNLNEQEDEM